MKRVLLGSVLAAMALVSFQASADEFAPKRNEISVSGTLDSISGVNGGPSTTLTSVMGSYGYYFQPQLVGTVSAFLVSESSGGTTTSVFDIGVGAKYYFSVGKKGDFTPWVEGDVSIVTAQAANTTANGFAISGALGGTYWVTETAGAFVDLRLRSSTETANGNSYNVNETMGEFGVTVKF